MCAVDAVLGTPDFGQMLFRGRVVERIASSGDKPCVLFGPSGCGKSVAAAHYASSSQRRTVWLDAGGEFVAASQIAHSTLRALRLSERRHRQGECPPLADVIDALVRLIQVGDGTTGEVLLVVDDLGSPLSPREELLGLDRLARSLWRVGSRLIVTSRSVHEWPSDVLRGFSLVGSEELALTSEEAEGYLSRAGLDALLGESDALKDACGGHPAFFVLMAMQASEHGLSTRAARTPSLDAWLRHTVEVQFTDMEKRALSAATLLRTGSDIDLRAMGFEKPVAMLDAVAAAMPLATCSRTPDGGRSFRIHELIDGFLADMSTSSGSAADSRLVAAAVKRLSARRDFARAAELLARQSATGETIAWLSQHGRAALEEGHYASLRRLIAQTPVAALMAEPHLLLVWAEVCAETGLVEEAFAKCRAARTLAEHAGASETAYRALALCARYAGRANRIEEAEELASEILRAPQGQVSNVVLGEALVCRAQNAVTRGEYSQARGLLEEAVCVSRASSSGGNVARKASRALSLIPALAWGDYLASSRMLAPTIVEDEEYLTDRVMIRGNVAACLCEAGRLPRCEQLLRSALAESQPAGLHAYSGAYLAVMGCAKVGRGESTLGVSLLREGIANSVDGGDEQGADQSRVYLAVALRASGEFAESLVTAERAFERLCVRDAFSFRRLAALEVAASLLALGDSSAAAAWAGAVVQEGFDGNQYHALRGAMILAEVDRREGRLEDAIARIGDESSYLLSENSNWQTAMYCRAFPSLLGVIAAAVGPGKLPEHLLRMIPAEGSERVLTETRAFLDSTLWRELGDRLIGEAGMTRYLDRGGLPLCHVRLLGGLEVSVGGRTIGERDWRKRKARMLFAMLVTKRGSDVPREQVIDHLWPDMEEERARNNLYVAWSIMKAVLGGPDGKAAPSPYVESVGGVCRIVRDAVRSDVDEFEDALLTARDAEAASNAVTALSAYERIGDLYRGDLLPGDVYDDWFASLRDHYRSEFVDAMVRASRLLISDSDPGNALVYLRRAIQVDPLREDLYQRALRCQIAAGQRSSAIETYFQCRDNLSEELGLDPSVETRALYDQILAMENRPVPIPLDPLRSRRRDPGSPID